jgi:hypothetical protein
MPLLSPIDDFLFRSLGSVKSAVARLKYLGEIRCDAGYEHWGMERTYGAERANAALAEIHSRLWLEVLRSPIKQLRAESNSVNENLNGSTYLGDSAPFFPGIIPPDTRGGSVRHMRLIVTTLSMLREKDSSTHRAA